MKCFCGMADPVKTFSLISKFLTMNIARDPHHHKSLTSLKSRADMIEPTLKLISGLIESICVVVITIIPWQPQPIQKQLPCFILPPLFKEYLNSQVRIIEMANHNRVV